MQPDRERVFRIYEEFPEFAQQRVRPALGVPLRFHKIVSDVNITRSSKFERLFAVLRNTKGLLSISFHAAADCDLGGGLIAAARGAGVSARG